MNRPQKILILLTLTVLCNKISYSQYGAFGSSDAFSMGLANTYTAAGENVLSIGRNPAMACLPEENDYHIYMLFPNKAEFNLSGEGAAEDLFHYFLDPNLNLSILQNISDNGGYSYSDLNTRLIALTITGPRRIGTFGFSISDYYNSFVYLPKTVQSTMNYGSPVFGKSEDFLLRSNASRSYSLTYSRDIYNQNKKLHIITSGVTLRIISGFSRLECDSLLVSLLRNDGLVNANIDGFFYGSGKDPSDKTTNSPFLVNGTGFSFDIGIALRTTYGLTLGFSLTDIGFMDWDNVSLYHIGIDTLITTGGQFSYSGILGSAKKSREAVANYNTATPATFRMGMMYDLNKSIDNLSGDLKVAADLNFGLAEQPVRYFIPRISAGILWRYGSSYPAISTGITNTNTGRIFWAAGLGYSTKYFDAFISTLHLPALFTDNEYLKSYSFSFLWKIDYSGRLSD